MGAPLLTCFRCSRAYHPSLGGIESSDTSAPSGGLNSGSVSVNGGRGASNGFMINGGTHHNDGVENTAAIVPNLDSIQEFRIITSNFDAEYGNYSGGQVNVVTKNGTNQWHGSGFEFLRNTVFNARGYTFSPTPLPRSSYDQNIYGGTLGGPIKKDKIFFFADFQGTNKSTAATTSTVVPSAADLTGNVSDWVTQFNNYGGVVQGPGWATVYQQEAGLLRGDRPASPITRIRPAPRPRRAIQVRVSRPCHLQRLPHGTRRYPHC